MQNGTSSKKKEKYSQLSLAKYSKPNIIDTNPLNKVNYDEKLPNAVQKYDCSLPQSVAEEISA
jgi:hypothetical protein